MRSASNALLRLCIHILAIFPSTFAWNPNCSFPAIFNFGDSNSDTGGLWASGLLQLTWPYGETYFERVAGRWSDGRLIIDFMAAELGLPFLDGYLDSMGTNFTHGANFATSRATMGPPTLPVLPQGPLSPFDLHTQLLQFNLFKYKAADIAARGDIFSELVPGKEALPKALYALDIGQNDVAILLYKNMSNEEIKRNVVDIINNFTDNVRDLYNAGARFFWVSNTGPLGCMTYIMVLIPSQGATDRAGCIIRYNKVSQHFNWKLKDAVNQLRWNYPRASFFLVDIYSIKYSLFENPERYGFKNTFKVCCGYGGKYNYGVAGCGENVTIGGQETTVQPCDKPWEYVNWDGSHLTEAANHNVFDLMSTGVFTDPPVPLKRACLFRQKRKSPQPLKA